LSPKYEFTEDWFSRNEKEWDQVVSQLNPRKVIEIGSYEGRSACYLTEKFAARSLVELHCIDTWEGGEGHDPSEMPFVEQRFDRNIERAQETFGRIAVIRKHKMMSAEALIGLAFEDRNPDFDLIYIDGSHVACDVLTDAILAFRLLRVGGLMIFDDYLWGLDMSSEQDFLQVPKSGVDAFVNVFQRKVQIVRDVPLHQLFVVKTHV
jgi:predicted O-methyltransferase YrrM